MNTWLTIRVALRALGKNRLRAGLTVLGVVIGIAAVTTMVSVGQSASQLIMGQFQSLGTNMIVITPARQRRGGVRMSGRPSLKADDARAIAQQCPSVAAVSPLVGTGGQAVYGNNNWNPKEIFGVGPDYLAVRNWAVRHGGFFTERDVVAASKVCVIGQTIVARLFQTANPLGQSIRVRNIPLRVIGVLEPKGANLVGDDQDDIILIPYTTVRKRLQGSNFNDVHAILASARSMELMAQAQTEIEQLLLERHRISPGEPPDFDVFSVDEIANTFSVVTSILTALLASIAGVSLLVGGVGIMNIMLVSVTERTREIGIRMAVGARPRDILRQFLVESVLLSCIGGAVGFALGVAASSGVIALINSLTSGVKWDVVISLPAALMAFLFAAGVGVFFGYYPARRASRMDPIEALRYE